MTDYKNPGLTVTQYDLNKQAFKKVEKDTNLVLNSAFASIGAWFSVNWRDKHFMLMNHDIRYFTTIHMNDMNYEEAKNEVRACVESQGEVWHIDYNHANDLYEIWVKRPDDEFYCYVLFDSQPLTIEIGGEKDEQGD